ncbi:MAG: phosphatase PAP2 family protein [Bacteroidetes bacterium]|nr:phosphatase PAP2 family protein [Bacteroidota bacterium]
MLNSLIETDHYLFRLINQEWTHPWLDVLMPIIRNQFTWVPVYFFLLSFGYNHFRRQLLMWVGLFLLTFALTDLISSQIFKAYFERPRPCWEIATQAQARMLIPCSHAFSFVSSHAANHFGISTFLFITLTPFFRRRNLSVVYVWAGMVGLAQVYVGAHFPGDVVGGGILGILIGIGTGKLSALYLPLKPFNAQS